MPEVQISEACHRKIEYIVAQSAQYDSVDAFVEFVLREVLWESAAKEAAQSNALQERLKALGYL